MSRQQSTSISADTMSRDHDASGLASSAGGPSSLPNKAGVPLHRIRFVDWQPSSVSALAFLPLPGSVQRGTESSSSSRSLLAVGRDNGNIDLCTWVEDDGIPAPYADDKEDDEEQDKNEPLTIVSKGWVVDTTLMGSNPSKVESLVFILSPTLPYPTPRLFSTSGGAIVTEHFLPPHLLVVGRDDRFSATAQELPASIRKSNTTLGGASRSLTSQGGSVWSLAASPLGKYLAIGCEDGTVRIIDVEDGRFELLTYSRSARRAGDGSVQGVVGTLDRAKTRIVSLAWGPPKRRGATNGTVKTTGKQHRNATLDQDSESSSDDDDEDDDEWEDSFIIGGTTQSSALVWSVTTGRITSKLLTDRHRREQTIVWSVATLADGTCILGDSLGHVSFFDAKTYTLLNGGKFASHGKNADVLALCVGPDGKSVYSASVDQKVVEYALVEGGVGQKSTSTWVSTGRRRLHAHDIRAIAIDPPYDIRAASLLPSSAAPNRLPLLVTGGVDFHLVVTPASSPSSFTILTKAAPAKHSKYTSQRSSEGKRGTLQSRKITAHDHVNPISSTAVTTFADTIHRRLPFVPATGRGSALGGGSVIRVCAERRWIVARREKSIGIWKLPDDASLPSNAEIFDDMKQKSDDAIEGWQKVLDIQAKVQTNLVCVEISHDGRFLIVSDLYETKLFELRREGDDVLPKRIRSFSYAFAATQGVDRCPGCSAATFTPDNARVVIASQPGSFLHVVELPTTAARGTCTLIKSFAEHRQAASGRAVAGKVARMSNGAVVNGTAKHLTNGQASLSSDESEERGEPDSEDEAGEVDSGTPAERTSFRRIDIVQCSPDGQYLVSIDTAKRMHTYSLDTLHHRGAMPSPAQQPNAVVFDPWQPNRMLCIMPTNQVALFDLETRRQIESTEVQDKSDNDGEQNGFVAALNERLAVVREHAIGAFWLNATVIVVWGATFMCTARLIRRERVVKGVQAAPASASATSTSSSSKRKAPSSSKRDVTNIESTQKWSYWRSWLLTKYQPLLYVGTVPSVRRGTDDDEIMQVTDQQQPNELVVVERPYYDVARSLPPTWFGGAAYGT